MVEDKEWIAKVKKLVNLCQTEDINFSGSITFWFRHGQQVILDKVDIYEASDGWVALVNGRVFMQRGKWEV